ncbi:hypothetical protein ACFQ0T_01260 [Kitasatospora gansuensis]
MAVEEKRAWTMLLVTVAAYAAYLAAVLDRPEGLSLTQAPYVSALLWSVGGAIVASILLHIVVSTFSPRRRTSGTSGTGRSTGSPSTSASPSW